MEENKQNNNIPDQLQDDEQEIDWMEIIQKLWKRRKTLYKAIGISFVLGVLIALGIPRKYSVIVTLSPEMSDGKSSGLSSLAASFLGTSMSGSSVDALNATLSSDIVASTPFILDLLDIQVQTLDGKIDTTFCAYLKDGQGINVVGTILHAPGLILHAIKSLFKDEIEPDSTGAKGPIYLSEDQSQMIEAIKEKIVADVDKKTAITTISVSLGDPKVAAIVADSAVSMLQRYIINYRIAKAKEDCSYLEMLYKDRQAEYYEAQSKYAQYMDANRNLVLQSVRTEQERLQNDMSLAFQVYSQVAQQLQMARAKIQEAKPVFAVLEPAVVPLQPAGPGRKIIVLAILFLGVAGTAGWILYGEDFYKQLRAKLKETTAE